MTQWQLRIVSGDHRTKFGGYWWQIAQEVTLILHPVGVHANREW